VSDKPEESSLLVDSMQVLDALMASYQTSKSSVSSSLNACQSWQDGAQNHRHGNAGPPPALQFLYEACVEQKRRVGCGVTTLICMAAYWAPEILALMKQVKGFKTLGIVTVYYSCL